MISYIIRRFTQSFLTVLLILFVLWSVQVYVYGFGANRNYQRVVGRVAGLQQAMEEVPLVQREGTGSRYNRMRIEKEGEERDKRALEQQYSVDKPWPFSFLAWLYDPADTSYYNPFVHADVPYGLDVWVGPVHITGSGLLTGDWGQSRVPNQRFPTGIQGEVGNTLLLLGLTLLISVLIALPVGVLGAIRHDTKTDHAVTFLTMSGLSTPPFVTGFLLILFFGIIPYQLHNNNGWTWLPYLPTGGGHTVGKDGDFFDTVYHMVLPLATLVLIVAPGFSRYVRSSMLDVLSKDYIRTAKAKGVRPFRVFFGHALRNAGLPLIAAVGLSTPFIITSLGITEVVFSYPGVGAYFTASILRGGSGPPVLQAVTIAVVVISLLNMLADITYTIVDPRVNYSKA
ncbi:MAG: peptide/nickel transport system permease protein [Chloroflexia bacterium]|jgi:peptide/nickel transport system permease protein|nr:peptide/nickel transport system permease protein [Chloroflexia bacterium]